jgi:hypothetical protein
MDFDFDLPTANPDDVREIEIMRDGKSYGIFSVKHQFVSSPKWLLEYKRAMNKLSKRERARSDDAQTEEDIVIRRRVVIRMLVENYITKSEGVPVKDGVWTHSTENLFKFLSDDRAFFIFQEIDEFASELSNFQNEAVADAKKK